MWRILTSSKLAIWLIVTLAIEMGIAMFIPQVGLSEPDFAAWAVNNQVLVPIIKALELNAFFTTPIFLITVSLFWLNTLCCTYGQLQRTWYNFKNPKLKGLKLYKAKVEEFNLKEIVKAFKGTFEKFRFSIKYGRDKEQTIILAYRNKWGLWGMVIFHIAILWTILGAVWGVLNKAEGNTFVVEGFSFKELHQNYTNIYEGLLFREKHAGFEVKINQVNLMYREKRAPIVDHVQFSVIEDGQEVLRDSLYSNQMFDYRNYKIKINRRGFAPILEVDKGGFLQYNSLSLDVHHEPSGGESYRQKIYIKDLQKEIDFVFFPSPPDQNKRIVDYRIRNPQLQLTYLDELGHKQQRIIGLNKPIIINGQKVSLVDAKPYVELMLNKTPGVYQVYFGFVLALLGLSIYYGMPYQQMTITISKDGDLLVYSYTKFNSTNFEIQVEQVINEVSSIIPMEYTNLQRRDEEVW